MKSIGFVILTWNSEKYIQECLVSIINFKNIKTKIVVVDNGSTDKTVNILDKYANIITIIKLTKNLGTTKSRNIGIKELDGNYDYLCILDSDTIINENAFISMINVLENNDNLGIIAPDLRDYNGISQSNGRPIPSFISKLSKALPFNKNKIDTYDYSYNFYYVGYLMSACWLITKEAFLNIGYLDEKLFYAPEDIEYCMRAWSKGYYVAYLKTSNITHLWQRLSRKKIFSKHNWEHLKGLLYFSLKYHLFFSAKKINLKIENLNSELFKNGKN